MKNWVGWGAEVAFALLSLPVAPGSSLDVAKIFII